MQQWKSSGKGSTIGKRNILVVGASAGGIEPLIQLVAGLRNDLPAAVFVVVHLPANSNSILPDLLSRSSGLRAEFAQEGHPIENGRVYVAPADCHLLLRRNSIHIYRGPKENGMRPSVDTLFRTAARVYGPRVVGVILSGALDDGTMGMAAIKMRGGVTIIQDPAEATFAGMPASVLENVQVDYCRPISGIIETVNEIMGADVQESKEPAMQSDLVRDENLEEADREVLETGDPGTPSVFTCPECRGTLWEIRDGELAHFRCRVGHAYSIETLLAAQTEDLEAGLWAAVRALEEKRALCERLALQAGRRNMPASVSRFEAAARDASDRAAAILNVLHTAPTTMAEEQQAG